MRDIVDKVKSELIEMSETPYENGGLADLLTIKDVHVGDPGILAVHQYPALMVEPEVKTAASETTNYDVRDATVRITILVVAAEYYNPQEAEANGTGVLMDAADAVERWFLRYSNRRLDFLPGVRHLTVPTTEYDRPSRRGALRVKTAQVTLVVQRQYNRQQ